MEKCCFHADSILLSLKLRARDRRSCDADNESMQPWWAQIYDDDDFQSH